MTRLKADLIRDDPGEHTPDDVEGLRAEVARLRRVNDALMDHVERSMNLGGNSFALFQTASLLEQQVRRRTLELETALHDIEQTNRELSAATRNLETAQNRLTDALEAISDGFVLCDSDGGIVIFNSTFHALWRGVGDLLRPGVPFQQLIARAAERGLIRESAEARRWLARRSDGRQRRNTHVLEMADGRWLRISERPTHENGFVGIYSDITAIKTQERRRRERELAAKSTLLQATLDNLSQGVSVFNAELELVAWNHRLAELLDLPEDRLFAGAPLASFLTLPAVRRPFADDGREPGALVRWLKSTRSIPTRSLELDCPDGRTLEVRSNPMPDGGFVTTFADITHLRRSEAALRDSEWRIRLVTDAIPARIAYLDRDERYQFTNRAYEDWIGRTRTEIAGQRLRDLLTPDQYALRRPYTERVLAGESCEFDMTTPAANGETAYVHAVYVPHRAPDGETVLGFFSLLQDVTESKRAAAQLEEANRMLEERVAQRTRALTELNDKLRAEIGERIAAEEAMRRAKAEAEQANLSKTKFLAAASHDLLQPMNAARVFVAALAERRLGRRNMALVDNITESLEAVDDLLNTLLDLSKLDAGVLPMHVTDFRLEPLLRQLATQFSPLAEQRGLEFRMVPSSAVVRSDMALLGRILRNFLSNAVRYTPTGRVLLGCRRTSTGLRICVADTGIGIPADKTQEIFIEFHRLKGSRSSRDCGAGLGLAIVDRIARRLDHPIHVQSAFGRGSVFAVEVPYGSADRIEAPHPAAIRSEAGSLKGSTVLLIENEPTILAAMAALMHEWGCELIHGDGADAVLPLIAERPDAIDVVIADYHLDEGRIGIDALQAVRKRCGRTVPGIIITADRSNEVLARVKAHGLHLLTKPIKPAHLRSLMVHLRSRRGG
ncbi:NahK/ErcS family hybrid sensor histidine kinase/response regulator [Azospirillum sp.]|uniref:NahK/ErcS family hybrid sensor histidine kinase/response regulator n=1 Tax=Azospirillum sp. TaxID=34012 RepID=UPI003D71728D